MRLNSTLNHDIFVIKEALDVLERHFDLDCRDTESENYISTRLSYFRSEIARYGDDGGQNHSLAPSLFNMFSALYQQRPGNVDNLIWTDIKNELSRIAKI